MGLVQSRKKVNIFFPQMNRPDASFLCKHLKFESRSGLGKIIKIKKSFQILNFWGTFVFILNVWVRSHKWQILTSD